MIVKCIFLFLRPHESQISQGAASIEINEPIKSHSLKVISRRS